MTQAINSGKVFYVGTHRYCFHAGVPAEIVGVALIAPEELKPRPCFHLRVDNGDEDFAPIEDRGNYELISEADIVDGRIPAIVH